MGRYLFEGEVNEANRKNDPPQINGLRKLFVRARPLYIILDGKGSQNACIQRPIRRNPLPHIRMAG
jgi:hypothetical protein